MAAALYGGPAVHSPLRYALIYTPLHLLWGGAEAVVVFFVLSGFVLARAIRSRSFSWYAYFPSRILRLYLPVFGAVAFACLVLLLPHDGATDSPWLTGRPAGYPFADIVKDITLLGGTSGVVSPLWTLRWEVIFSLLLPVAAFAVRAIPAWMLGLVCIVLSNVGAAAGSPALQYLPIFGVGVALEGEWERIGRVVARTTRRLGPLVWTAVLLAATVLLSMHWLLLAPLGHAITVVLAQTPIVLGAVILVIAAVHCSTVRRILTWRPVAWLGGISFSLYLIHEPIVILMANVTDSMRWTLVTAVPLALLLAWLFWMVIEHPAHLISRSVRAHATPPQPEPAPAASDDDTPSRSEADRAPVHA
ncbi:hypothetical protein GCM10022240_25160 [Microbacterium kribbense]|uniref:Acyltransferase 3 domain-containing protein n=2 Tax=Microbacterium kribbense TaxID=433645 RepID=A0ABP7GPR3_9MICO